MDNVEVGLVGEKERLVTEADTAESLGSGSVAVFGTPALVALMEGAAVSAVASRLEAGTTTVGTRMDVRHLAATPVGMNVRARAELVEVDGRRLQFHVEAWDDAEPIGEATHERFVVDAESFVDRTEAKRS